VGRVAINQALALDVAARLRAAGVRTFCLCPGGRNAPLVEVLSSLAGDLEVLDFFEERSAAFFALGRARRDRRPAAVVTTSGTACAELLPAMVEAYYEMVPLVALTADRPRAYRGTAAPQTIEQPGIFGIYARQSFDLEAPGGEWSLANVRGPAHVNVCFDEPLLGGWVAEAAADVPASVRVSATPCRGEVAPGHPDPAPRPGFAFPLVLLGALDTARDREDAQAFCVRLGAPVLAESSSHLKPALGDLLLRGGESAARRAFDEGLFDSVVRIGDVPSFRIWRDLEIRWDVPVVSASRRPWSGLTRAVHHDVPPGCPLSGRLPELPPFPVERRQGVSAWDRDAAAAIEGALAEFPKSEPALVRALSRRIPRGSFVYLGNSQPIREWNHFAAVEDRGFLFGENRGANGIDGQLSTCLGEAAAGRENWAVLGDLTALYDLQGLWALRHVSGPVRIVVINNGGGRIFERMFSNPRFQNRHSLSFGALAASWGCEYQDAGAGVEEARLAPGSDAALIELRPDESQTAAFWRALRTRVAL
jgi:2-succinyl-5-enolpyruvyl-6-hydroxy-3-cyclohexene-1-carboxylate synthase